MIQYYLDLKNQVKIIREKNLSGSQIQKIYSTAFYISMAIRTPGKTWHIYLGRGGGYEGVWLHDSPPPSSLRKKDTFLEYLRRHLSSCGLDGIELDEADRILKISYRKYGQLQSLWLFWKARKMYFIHHYQDAPESPYKILLSWRGKAFIPSEEVENFYAFFDEVGRRNDIPHDLSTPNSSTIDELLKQEFKAASVKLTSQKPGFLQRKKINIQEDLRRAQQWEKLQSLLEEGTPLEGHEISVGDHKIKFEGQLNSFERRNVVFQKIKKLRRGEGILNERLKSVEEMLEGKEETKEMISSLPVIRPIWGKTESPKPAQTLNPHHDFRVIKLDNCQLGVGNNANGNDQLRNKWASKEDIWFHLDGIKSAHAILKLDSPVVPSPELVNLVASILAYFSHFNGDWIPIIFTSVKNLKGVTGAPGMVTYKKEKHLSCPRVEISTWLKE